MFFNSIPKFALKFFKQSYASWFMREI